MKKTEILFLHLFLRLLDSGGRGAVIVPEGVLFGSSNAHVEARKKSSKKTALMRWSRCHRVSFVRMQAFLLPSYSLRKALRQTAFGSTIWSDETPLGGPSVMLVQDPASVLAWPAKLVDVAQPATRRMQARTPRGLVACSRAMHAA